MDNVARLPASDRAALFNETGAARGVTNAIIEKDFWVCWTLKRVFGLQGQGNPGLVFKGGTSLSKAYGAIRRFSEDIDLSFDRKDLGYGGERDPEKVASASKKKAKKLIDNLVADVEHHIATVLLPRLKETIAKELGPSKEAGWSLVIDDQEPQNLLFHYPPSLGDTDYAGLSYLSRRVKLEFGARGDAWPVEHREIQPYAAEEFQISSSRRRAHSTCWRYGERSGKRRPSCTPNTIDRPKQLRRATCLGTTTTWPCWLTQKAAKPQRATPTFSYRWPIINRCTSAQHGHNTKPPVAVHFD
jgi:hypothetical protein